MVDWNTDKVKSEAVRVAEGHGLPLPKDVTLSNRMVKSWGRTDFVNKIIRLNKRFVEINNEEVVRALLVHEIVHLKFGNHGSEFVREMERLGYGRHVNDRLDILVEKHFYKCRKCDENFESLKKICVLDHYCGKCEGWLLYIGTKIVSF